MNKNIYLGSAVILLLVIFSGVAIYRNNTGNINDRQYKVEEPVNSITRPTETLNARYQYKTGQHIFIGDLVLPNPCYTFNTEIIKRENETEIAITTQSTGEMCIQVISEQMFKVSFEGNPDDLIIASINGELVNLNIFEIPANEDIDEIEVFIKG
jgi:hypothetical protein